MTHIGNIVPNDFPNFYEHGAAPCTESDPEAFFSTGAPGDGRYIRPTYSYEREAKKVCSSCPYQIRCLQYALAHPDEQGIWGGTTEDDRQRIKRSRTRLSISPVKYR